MVGNSCSNINQNYIKEKGGAPLRYTKQRVQTVSNVGANMSIISHFVSWFIFMIHYKWDKNLGNKYLLLCTDTILQSLNSLVSQPQRNLAYRAQEATFSSSSPFAWETGGYSLPELLIWKLHSKKKIPHKIKKLYEQIHLTYFGFAALAFTVLCTCHNQKATISFEAQGLMSRKSFWSSSYFCLMRFFAFLYMCVFEAPFTNIRRKQ